MNTEIQVLPAPAAEPSADLHNSEPLPPTDPDQPRRKGKIAHLPKAQRDLINQGFDDGVKYEDIRSKLAEQGVNLNLKNLSDWYHGGYQDELKARERRAQVRESQERLLEMARHDDASDLSLVGLQLAVTQLSQQLYDLDPGCHKENFQTDANNYLRLHNTLGRLSRALLSLQQYRDKKAQSTATELQKLDEDRDLNDNESLLLVNRMDRLFRRKVSKSFLASPKPDVGELATSKPPSEDGSADCRRRGDESLINEQPTAPALPIVPATSAPPTPLPAALEPSAAPASPALPEPQPLSGTNPPIYESINPVPGEVGRVTPCAPPPATNAAYDPQTPDQSTSVSPSEPSTFNLQPSTASETINHEPRTTDESAIENQKSKIENLAERCHYCRRFLPPRLPNGQRPSNLCAHCGTALHALELLHLYCPTCGARMDEIFENGHRMSDTCPRCFTTLPDDAPDPPNERHAA